MELIAIISLIVVVLLLLFIIFLMTRLKSLLEVEKNYALMSKNYSTVTILQEIMVILGNKIPATKKLERINEILINRFDIAYSTIVEAGEDGNIVKASNLPEDLYSQIVNLDTEKLFADSMNQNVPKYITALKILEYPSADRRDIRSALMFPLYREDVEDYPDIAEEVIREYGYDHIGSTLLETSKVTLGGKTKAQARTDNIKNLLCGYGFNEIITYSFVSKKDYSVYDLDETKEEYKYVEIINPLSEDVNIMRTTLIPSMVQVVLNNINRKKVLANGKCNVFRRHPSL